MGHDGDLIGVKNQVSTDETVKYMKVIRPRKTLSQTVPLLKRLDFLLRRCEELVQAASLDPRDESIREIQGNRYEIFVAASEKSSAFFDSLCERLVDPDSSSADSVATIRSTILGYCTEASHHDERTNNLQLGNFSIIVNYDPVEDQQPHIDLLAPNHQFGCLLTDNTPGTKAYRPCGPGFCIASASDLQRVFPEIVSDGIVKAITQHSTTSQLLQGFGNVLSPCLQEICAEAELPTGTVLSLPGSVIHAGPTSPSFRAILFFSGWPRNNPSVVEYDPDTQYFSGLLLCDMLLGIWADLCFDDRVRFLAHVIDTILTQPHPPKQFVRHLRPGPLHDVCVQVFHTTSEQMRKELIAQAAHHAMDERSEALHLVSIIDGLWTHFEGEEWRIRVFRRGDGKHTTNMTVCFQYVDQPTAWEGTGDRPYRLELHNNDEVFDGTNGRLICNEGNEIPCSRKEERKRPR